MINILSRFKPKKSIEKMSVFEKFWSGNHQALAIDFQSNPSQFNNPDDIHYIYASMAIIDADLDEISKKVEPPLSLNEFESKIKDQYLKEISKPQSGVLNQPRYVHKSMLAASIGLANEKSNFVETGTYTGNSTYKISSLFSHLSTIEASQELYKAASSLLGGCKNVSCVLGNSKQLLESLTTDYLNNSVVFLDAHYSTGLTSNLYGACPVIEEILEILNKAPKAILIIDDIRTMNGKEGYPSLAEILNAIPSNIKVDIVFDQMIFTYDGIINYPSFMSV
jgi:predicted O-methyltransferase YrrM